MNYLKATLSKINNSESVEELAMMAVTIETMTYEEGWSEDEASQLLETLGKRQELLSKSYQVIAKKVLSADNPRGPYATSESSITRFTIAYDQFSFPQEFAQKEFEQDNKSSCPVSNSFELVSKAEGYFVIDMTQTVYFN